MTVYVGFAMSDSMFPDTCAVSRWPCPVSLAMKLLQPPTQEAPEPVVNCCNASHAATLAVLKERYGIDLTGTVPPTPPRVALKPGDVLLVLGVRGLPRLTDRHEYTQEEVAAATFNFGVWSVDR
jgi:glutamate racemase